MKICCASDTHGMHRLMSMPKADVFVFAGDYSETWGDSLYELTEFNQWLGELDYDLKIMIAGNHDVKFESKPDIARKCITNAIYLENKAFEWEGIKFFGSPVTPVFAGAFNYVGKDLEKLWNNIPLDTNVLITHGPPWGILDENSWGENCGDRALYRFVTGRLFDLRAHIFGHIHEDYGIKVVNNTHYVNAAQWDHVGKQKRTPWVIEI